MSLKNKIDGLDLTADKVNGREPDPIKPEQEWLTATEWNIMVTKIKEMILAWNGLPSEDDIIKFVKDYLNTKEVIDINFENIKDLILTDINIQTLLKGEGITPENQEILDELKKLGKDNIKDIPNKIEDILYDDKLQSINYKTDKTNNDSTIVAMFNKNDFETDKTIIGQININENIKNNINNKIENISTNENGTKLVVEKTKEQYDINIVKYRNDIVGNGRYVYNIEPLITQPDKTILITETSANFDDGFNVKQIIKFGFNEKNFIAKNENNIPFLISLNQENGIIKTLLDRITELESSSGSSKEEYINYNVVKGNDGWEINNIGKIDFTTHMMEVWFKDVNWKLIPDPITTIHKIPSSHSFIPVIGMFSGNVGNGAYEYLYESDVSGGRLKIYLWNSHNELEKPQDSAGSIQIRIIPIEIK